MKLGIDVITDVEEVDKWILQDVSTCNSIFSFCQSEMGAAQPTLGFGRLKARF